MTPAICPALPLTNLKPGVASIPTRMYRPAVAANSATGFGDPSNLAHKRPITIAGAFLCPQLRVMAAVRGRPSGLPGSKFPVRQPAHSCHHLFGDDSWQLHTKLGAVSVQDAIAVPVLRIRAAAHRAMAIAALHADSSLVTRLKRYNAAMAKARALEGQGGGQ